MGYSHPKVRVVGVPSVKRVADIGAPEGVCGVHTLEPVRVTRSPNTLENSWDVLSGRFRVCMDWQ